MAHLCQFAVRKQPPESQIDRPGYVEYVENTQQQNISNTDLPLGKIMQKSRDGNEAVPLPLKKPSLYRRLANLGRVTMVSGLGVTCQAMCTGKSALSTT